MDKGHSPVTRPTFKRTLRRIGMIEGLSRGDDDVDLAAAFSISTVLALRDEYAQKEPGSDCRDHNRTLEAALVFSVDSFVQQLKHWRHWPARAFSTAEVRDKQQNILASWHYPRKDPGDTFSNFISHWLFPAPIIQPIRHNGETIGEVRLTARDSSISRFIYLFTGMLTGCILLASGGSALMLTRYLDGVVEALQDLDRGGT
ncbi:CHASE sensor domain-containing protein [Shigella flexneri]